MVGLLDSCDRLFHTRNLYEVLSITQKSTDCEVKRGYHKLSLRVHPDRVGDDEKAVATQKFQVLGQVYGVLSDKGQRATYDETGTVHDDGDTADPDRDWVAYWRLLFAKVTEKDILDFETKYKGSQAELEDVKRAYLDHEGDLAGVVDSVMCATVDDEPRFIEILSPIVSNGDLPAFEKFTKDTAKRRNARRKKATKEAVEAEELKEQLGMKGDNSLSNMIQLRMQSRENQMDDFLSNLEAKYSKSKRPAKNSTIEGSTSKKSKANMNKRK